MLKVAISTELRSLLKGGQAKATFVDEAGKPLGHYLPDELYQLILEALAPAGENDRAEAFVEYQNGSHISSAEVLASIEESGRRWAGQP